ncbi:MAG: carboxymuconolactone decarboxylase family protein [Gemmatimonadota bacterium]
MSWIRTIGYDASGGILRRLYDRLRGPGGSIDEIMRLHSLRPHTLSAHMALYKSVLHHAANEVPAWLVELLGVHVSRLNGCGYCVEHHYAGLRRVLGDDERAEALRAAARDGEFGRVLEPREAAALDYAERLTLDPAGMDEARVRDLREAGWTDAEILEINQVVSYFAYANRTALGLGASAAGEVLGLAPRSEDPDDWTHV